MVIQRKLILYPSLYIKKNFRTFVEKLGNTRIRYEENKLYGLCRKVFLLKSTNDNIIKNKIEILIRLLH